MSKKKQLIQKLEIKIKYNWAKIGRIIWLKNKKSTLKKTALQKLQKNIQQLLLFVSFRVFSGLDIIYFNLKIH